MKYIETPWFKLSRFFGIGFGIPCTLIGVFFYFNDTNIAFLLNGILWIAISLLLELKGRWDESRLKKIMANGDCYEAYITKIIPLNMVKIGNYITARIECVYKIDDIEHKVISGLYLLSHWDKLENFYILVYVSKYNKNRYIVVACRKEDIFKV